MTTMLPAERDGRLVGRSDTPVDDSSGSAIPASLPTAPSPTLLWTRALVVASLLMGAFLLDQTSELLLGFWLLESMGYESVFWTNFWTGTVLMVSGLVLFTVAIGLPAFLHGVGRVGRRSVVWCGVLVGLGMGAFLASEYLEFLGPMVDIDFGTTDPVYGRDLSFYLFDLPAWEIVVETMFWVGVAGTVVSVATALSGSRRDRRPPGVNRFVWTLARVGRPYTLVMFMLTGLSAAVYVWMGRYWLLLRENFTDSTEGTGQGAEYLDVTGFFSTRNSLYVEALAVLALAIGVSLKLRSARRVVTAGRTPRAKSFGVVAIALVLLPGITSDLVFRSFVAARDQLFVLPNEPVVQLPYLQRHIDATNTAFGLDRIQESTYVPPQGGEPLPDLEAMLADPAIRNAPLWSGYTSRYGRRVAPQYVQRILLAEGDMTVYGPTQEMLQAQQKLRPYYEFLDVDTTVYTVDGEPRMFASAARELPQDVIRPWLSAWGQRSFLFTHGHGLVTVDVAERTGSGEPVYGTGGIPTEARWPELAASEESFYYGEGATLPAFSNARGIAEHDRPTEQGRAEVTFAGEDAGIVVDSLLKRLVIGYEGGNFVDTVFSGMIGEETRAHVMRRPLERVEQVAPFLALDTDPYAFVGEDKLQWMVNAMTWSDQYPYSGLALLGDNSDLRTEERPLMEVNYIADSVKVTIDATTGQTTLYKVADEPVVDTWAAVYPELFRDGDEMPADVRAQVQYPQALMSIQFNKIYPFYHQRDALTFFSSEDLLDDADEVVGPIRGESGAITFSQGLYNWMAAPSGPMADSSEPVQFALSKNYSPQDALNLRAIASVYQTGEDYGELSVMKVPKGRFFPGPEQADSAIDQDSFIAQQIGLLNREGVEVIRGNTVLMVVQGEALYVEPIFIRSRQNPVPQLQRVVVVLRGEAHMGRTVEEALRFAVEGGRLSVDATSVTTATLAGD